MAEEDETPIKYKRSFDLEDLHHIKIKHIGPGGESLSKECAKFTSGLEQLLYALRDYELVSSQLGFDVIQKFDRFEEILGQNASLKWRRMLFDRLGNLNYAQTNQGWANAKRAFIMKYDDDLNSRGKLIDYIGSRFCKKPFEVSENDHSERLEELFEYADMLIGTRGLLSENEKKTLYLKSHPVHWKADFNKHHRIEVESMESIIRYMKQSSAEDAIKKRHKERGEKKSNKRKGGGGKHNPKKGKNEKGKWKGKSGDKNWCRKPGHNHLWKDCPDNFRNKIKNKNKNNDDRNEHSQSYFHNKHGWHPANVEKPDGWTGPPNNVSISGPNQDEAMSYITESCKNGYVARFDPFTGKPL